MIITGKDTKTPLIGGNANPLPTTSNPTGSSSQMDPPPSYGTVPVQPYPAQQNSTQYIVQQEYIHRQSATRRFFGAFLYAILIWLLVSMLVQSIVGLAKWSHQHGGWYNLQGSWAGEFPVPSDISIGNCIQGYQWVDEHTFEPALSQNISSPSRYPFSAKTSFNLPLLYDTLFLLARGSQSYGTVNVMTSQSASQLATVHLTARYFDRGILDSGAKVCLIKRTNNDLGVGIFTRPWIGPEHSLRFETSVVFPKSENANQALQIKNFETDVPNTSHTIGDLIGLVDFQDISLKGSNAPIHINSILAHKGAIQTSNSPIEGTFNISSSLSLKTSNAPIKVDVSLIIGKLGSDARLTSSLATGSRYLVTASTSNGPLHVKFPTAPADSTLKLQATTSNSPASILLHPSYEGSFLLTSSVFSPSVKQREVDDPSGRERRRTVLYSKYGMGVIKGQVSWSQTDGPGSVTVKTSNSLATIEL